MADVILRKGQAVAIKAAYQTRGFLLGPGEELGADPREFDRASHTPRLIQLQKGEICLALTEERGGQLLAKAERDGQIFACALLPDSYQPIT